MVRSERCCCEKAEMLSAKIAARNAAADLAHNMLSLRGR
jgi:hypothetical protein